MRLPSRIGIISLRSTMASSLQLAFQAVAPLGLGRRQRPLLRGQHDDGREDDEEDGRQAFEWSHTGLAGRSRAAIGSMVMAWRARRAAPGASRSVSIADVLHGRLAVDRQFAAATPAAWPMIMYSGSMRMRGVGDVGRGEADRHQQVVASVRFGR